LKSAGVVSWVEPSTGIMAALLRSVPAALTVLASASAWAMGWTTPPQAFTAALTAANPQVAA